MIDLEGLETLSHWDKWSNTLKKAVNLGESVGMSQDTIDKLATKIGNFLTDNVDPENREQRLLEKLWSAATESEKSVLAKVIIKSVQE